MQSVGSTCGMPCRTGLIKVYAAVLFAIDSDTSTPSEPALDGIDSPGADVPLGVYPQKRLLQQL